ncbi:MAG: DNA polymerase III subunit delta [Eggerthellaceae bacterium]|nr:DNA polymerase III subunit delta [Eggerthellaceae bacterium]
MTAKDNILLPYYFFIGEDALKRGVLEDRLKSRIAAMGDIDFNFAAFDGGRNTAEEVIAACETLPFLSDYRYVLLRNADSLNAANAKALAAYISNPSDTTVLAISATSLDAKSPLGKSLAAAPKKAVVDCSITDIQALVRSLAVGHGATIGPQAAALLVELAGSDTVHLDGELEKLALAHEGNDPITADEVRRMVAPLASEDFKPWEFLDALSMRDAARCFRILSGVPDGELIRLFSLVQGRLKELLAAKSPSCGTAAQLAQALGKKDWQVKNHLRWASNLPDGHLELAIISAAEAEAAMKSGTDPREAFIDWLTAYFTGK